MFFSFKSKYKLVKSGLLNGMTDVHSHVLPGVDDGSPNIDTSLELLQYMEQLGFSKVWLTPHVMEDFRNTNDHLRHRFEDLKKAYNGRLELHLSSEYMMDAGFTPRLHDEVLPIGDGRLLVETSYMYPPPGLDDILLDVWSTGYQPIIAHPERYNYMEEADYSRLKGRGYKFQLNLMSLSGYYGPRPKVVSEKLLQLGWYDFVGTDLHHLERYQPMLDRLKLTHKQLDALEILINNNAQI